MGYNIMLLGQCKHRQIDDLTIKVYVILYIFLTETFISKCVQVKPTTLISLDKVD